ncbi:hypothetical protein QWY31_11130 [Cytophagales bacterium LB-30]|uniref:Uncharacterized protein n=1 Tax=Shiella aurantiaca TaxID=3058365 RepID=A0ABT8F6P8_9BACT|nr:hypothetical protein [Shiella aurantiaca]MDN4166058.1 hypothetical protein [Shiella aurantiaca]
MKNYNKKIPMSVFINFLSSRGLDRRKCVQASLFEPYSPLKDFYKPLREKMIDVFRRDGDISEYEDFLRNLSHDLKREHYRPLISSIRQLYKKYKRIEWFVPRSAIWSYDKLQVTVNPELGLILDGRFFLVKLYFKNKKLEKSEQESILAIMEDAFSSEDLGAECVIWDLPRNKIIKSKGKSKDLINYMRMEVEIFLRIKIEIQGENSSDS